jgi:hypothetical protein
LAKVVQVLKIEPTINIYFIRTFISTAFFLPKMNLFTPHLKIYCAPVGFARMPLAIGRWPIANGNIENAQNRLALSTTTSWLCTESKK